ncbi:MAG: hypothetical protein KGH87_04600 [Thaumarchaeota archaeon]|nr:hypothetical protein [Candidatus Nitrosotalea sp.]MDE1813193.1 hypothetical protein [Nitrososphaerota archaeon]MDE1839183.1 hypothetical protein [Nitrososphaerota archaeon]
MKTLHLSIVLFIFGGISLAVTYGCFPIFASHTGLPGLPLPFDYFRAYFLLILTTSFFVMAIIFLINSRRKK